MVLDENTIERIKQASARITHGSIEILLDERKPFVDIIEHRRVRIEQPVPSTSVIGAGGKKY